MTTTRRRLVIPYNDHSAPFAGLANWSCVYPFQVDGKEYPTVDHYVYARLTLHRDDAQLLSIRDNDPALRFHFNRISNDLYYRLLRTILSQGVRAQYNDRSSSHVRETLQRHPSNYYYYITNDDIMWGINDQGYGFNLVGQAYSRVMHPDHSSFYHPLDASTIYDIYLSSTLLQHHLREGHDVLPYVGKSVEEISRSLTSMYPNMIKSLPLTAKDVFQRYHDDPFFEFIQYEIDYPWNLAGFIRQAFADKLNYYLRQRFHRIMILAYFRHVLSQKFGNVIDLAKVEQYAHQQLSKLSDAEYQSLADRLYGIYNDPDTTSKTHAFLTSDVRQQLYDTEMQFLSNDEVVNATTYVPFLYHIKVGYTTYIYDEYHGFTEELEPFTKSLSPFLNNPLTIGGTSSYENLAGYAFITLFAEWTSASLMQASKTFQACTGMDDYQETLANGMRAFKRILIQQGMKSKFRSSRLAQYQLYNTQSYGYDVNVVDPDPTFELQTNKELMSLRTKLEEDPVYALTYTIVPRHVPQLQDRIRFRIQDFVHTFEAYRRFLGKEKLAVSDYEQLESRLYRDPVSTFRGTTTTPERSSTGVVPSAFQQYFASLGDQRMIQRLWSFFLGYNDILESYITIESSDRPCTAPRTVLKGLGSVPVSNPTSITAIVAYFVRHFYQKGEEMAFYLFTLSVLTGKAVHSFTPSFAYYAMEMERDLRMYLPIDDYDVAFIVNVMGVVARLQKEMSVVRIQYFGYLPTLEPRELSSAPPTTTTKKKKIVPFVRKLRELGFPVIERMRDMTKRSSALEKKRKAQGKSRKQIIAEILQSRRSSTQTQQEAQDGEEAEENEMMDMQELYQEMGIQDDENENENDEAWDEGGEDVEMMYENE